MKAEFHKKEISMKATNIYFVNEDGERDETQFDTTDINELREIWWDFCKENGIIIDTEDVDIED